MDFSIGEVVTAGRTSAIVRILKEGKNYSGMVQALFVGSTTYAQDTLGQHRYRKGDRVLVLFDTGVYYCLQNLNHASVFSEDTGLVPGRFLEDSYLSLGRFSRFVYKTLFKTKVGFIINALTRKIKVWLGHLDMKWDGGQLKLIGGDTPEFEVTFHSSLHDMKDLFGPEASYSVKGGSDVITFKIGEVIIEDDLKRVKPTTVGSFDIHSDRVVSTSGTLFWERRKDLDPEEAAHSDFLRVVIDDENNLSVESNSGNFNFATEKNAGIRVVNSGGADIMRLFMDAASKEITLESPTGKVNVKATDIAIEGTNVAIKGKVDIN